MSSESLRLHPEVEGLLREIAAQPESMLLRVPRLPRADAFSSTRSELGGLESWLSRAERHLVDVHREEVSFALRQSAWRVLAIGHGGCERVHRVVTPALVVEVPSQAETRASASRGLQGVAAAQVEPEVVRLLEDLIEPEARLEVSPTRLLQAAHRLVPSERGRILAGSALALERRLGAARVCFSQAVCSGLPREFVAVAWNNLADVLDTLGRPDQALRSAESATRILDDFVFAEAARLWSALRVEDYEVARDAAARLDSAVPADDPWIGGELQAAWRAHRAPTAVGFSRGQRRVAQRILKEGGPMTRRLIDALT